MTGFMDFLWLVVKWLPDLDSHQDKMFNKHPCYFDTIRQ
jgi:hypothetical protein